MSQSGTQYKSRTPAEKAALRDAFLLSRASESKPSRRQLRRAVEMLSICHGSLEREVVSLHLIGSLSLQSIAGELGQCRRRVAELFHGVCTRHRLALDEIAKWKAMGGPPPPPSQHAAMSKKNPTEEQHE